MILFDFDGVIVNSLYEVALTSFNACTGECLTSLEDLHPTYRELFIRNRFHAQPAADFIPLAKWCMAESSNGGSASKLLENIEFQNILAGEESDASHRRDLFFSARQRFIDSDKNAWLEIHNVFSPPGSELKSNFEQPIVLLTHKNRAAVMELCEYFKLPIREKNVFSGDNGISKLQNLNAIKERFSSKNYHFIDDSIKNLRELKKDLGQNTDVKLFLAGWGYVGPDDVDHAGKENIDVIQQDQCIEWMQKFS